MHLATNSTLQSGKYRIIRALGQGGFGITYLAYNTFFERFVAIKEFFPKDFCGRDNTSHLTLGTQNNAATVARLKDRFLKEAKNISKLDHPGIIKIHDIFEENNTAYYVMDYIEGENLNELIKRDGPLPEAKAIEYIRKVGDALDYIHSRNMTHFDVKPANIMLRKHTDQPILIDFGLSKQYDMHGDATSALMPAISQGYSPLELYNAEGKITFSPQTDVYSLAATLYFLCTGSIPPSPHSIIKDGLQLPPSVSTQNAQAIKAAMAVIDSKRPATIAAFINSLTLHPASSLNDESTRLYGTTPNYNYDRHTKGSKSYKPQTSTYNKKSNQIKNSRSLSLIYIGLVIFIIGIGMIIYYSSEEAYFSKSPQSLYKEKPAKNF